MKQIFRKPYVFYIVIIFLFYLGLNFLISGFYETLKLILIYSSTLNWFKLGISIILTIAIGLFVSINSVLIYYGYKQRKDCKNASLISGAGSIGGLMVGICPLCVSGIFPLLLGLLGVSFSFGSLPFNGIEIQVLVLGVLIWGYMNLRGVKIAKVSQSKFDETFKNFYKI